MHNQEYLDLVSKLMSKTRKASNGCFIWTGEIATNGYGRVWCGYKFRKVAAHKLAAYLFRDAPMYEGSIKTLHKCGNKSCWNPEHTYEGTQKDNVRDSIDAGTHRAWGYLPRY